MIALDWHPSERRLRQFGVVLLTGSGLIGLAIWRFTGQSVGSLVVGALGVVLFIVALVAPRAVRPVYRVWLVAAMPVGWVVSETLLRVIFYGVLTPIGLLFRLIGRDALRLRRDPVSSYWHPRKQPDDVASYFRQA